MQEQERNAPKHALETVHYVAISTGTNRSGGSEWEAARVPNQLNHRLRQLDFEQPFSQPPVLLGAVQSHRGRDPVTLRYTSLSDKATAVFLEEERSKNAETWHTDEVVGYLALAPGPIERAVPLSTPLVQATPTPDLQATIPLWGSQTQGLQAPRPRLAPHPTADSVADQLWCRAVVSRDSGSRSASAPPSEFPSFEPLDIATALDVVTAGMFGLSRSGGN
jgi:hypothetical protein